MNDIVARLRDVAGFIQKEHGRVASAACLATEAADEIERLRAENHSVWAPIETAPKDGTLIIALTPSPQFVRWWVDPDGYGAEYPWIGRDGSAYTERQVTHWMPIPPIPKGVSL